MKEIIKFSKEQVNQADDRLYAGVIDLGRHMNECECGDTVKYDFSNILPCNEDHVFCLNCGGIVTPNKMEM